MSNKTLAEPVKKTASAPKSKLRRPQGKWAWIALLTLLVAATLGIWSYIIYSQGGPGCIYIIDKTDFDDPGQSPRRISGPNYECLALEQVTTPEAMAKGLSGRTSLPQDQGMLFTYSQPGEYCFWMKDMQFPIDIIWVDADKKVINVHENVPPESYPEEFCPDKPAMYVIEVNAGVAKQAYLSSGSQLQF